MRIQLIHLDPSDDTSSARERLRWAKAERIVIVWPGHGRPLARRLDLVLLQREAQRQGALLGAVVHDPELRDFAGDLGVPVFDDLDSVRADAWPGRPERGSGIPFERPERQPVARSERTWPSRNAPRQDPWRAGWVVFVIAALLALSIAVGPAAVVELTPTVDSEQASFGVILGEAGEAGSTRPVIPARIVEVEVEGTLRLPTEGQVNQDVAAAEGVVVFTNRDLAEAVIPESTGLRTTGASAVRFETTERALLPGGIGSQVTVPIRASSPGTAGNVAAEAIGAVEGVLGLQVSVENPEPTTGGKTSLAAGVGPEDVARAKAALETRLLQEANAQILESLDPTEALAPESVQVESIRFERIQPPIGEASESISVELRLLASALAFTDPKLDELARAALAEASGSERQLLADSVRIELQPGESPGAYQVSARAESVPQVDVNVLAASLAGTSPEQAVTILRSEVELQGEPRIHLWPDWWPRLPFLPWRIRPVWTAASP